MKKEQDKKLPPLKSPKKKQQTQPEAPPLSFADAVKMMTRKKKAPD